jgi:tetratricopeptide (TPR) repeat protein
MMIILLTAILIHFQVHAERISRSDSDLKVDRSYDDLMINGLEAFYQTDWENAQKYYDQLIELGPDDPRGYFFSSMIPFWKYFFISEDKESADEFFRLSDKAIKVAEQKLPEYPDDPILISMLSGLYGYQSLVASGENNVRTALRSGRTGYGYTKKLLDIDENMPEVHIGRGMHHYMVGSVPGALRWLVRLFGLNGDVETGFKELTMAAESESFVSTDAKIILAYLYSREKNYEKSLHYLYKLNSLYNKNVIFQFMLAETHELNGDIELALEYYTAVLHTENKNFKELFELSRVKKEQLNDTSF